MIVKPSPTANSYTLWIVDGHDEEEIRNGLSLGYIEFKGVRLAIDKIQDWNPTAPSLVTKLVHTKTSKESAERLNDLMVEQVNSGHNN